jgi:hypothetical protein
MKSRHETSRSSSGRHWVTGLAFVFGIAVLYVFGAIACRVLFVRGVLQSGTASYDFLSKAFTPIHIAYSRVPAFRSGFNWCAGLFVPKQKEEQ